MKLVLARFWSQLFGSSISVQRAFAVVVSLPLLPLTYWFCKLLFSSSFVAEVGIALISVSPFFILYSQENRPYGLWSTTILFSSIALLKALETSKFKWWLFYTIIITVGLYSFAFTILILLGHTLYILLSQKLKFSQTTKLFGLSCVTAIIAFIPWILIIYKNLETIQKTVASSEGTVNLFSVIKAGLGRIGYVFIDINPYQASNLFLEKLQYGCGLIVLIILFIAISDTCFKAPKASVFLNSLILGNLVPLMILDLILKGSKVRVITNRYIIPTLLCLLIYMAYFIARKAVVFKRQSTNNFLVYLRNQIENKLLLIILIFCIMSALISSPQAIWWTKGANYYVPEMAEIINQTDKTLVITDNRTSKKPLGNVLGDNFALSYALKPDIYLQLLIYPQKPQIPNNFKSIFLFNPSEELQQHLQLQNYSLTKVYGDKDISYPTLWQAKSNGS